MGVVAGLLLMAQPGLFAQIHYVQSASNVSTSSASGVSASFTSNTTAGNTIVVAASAAGPAINSVSDSQGNTYVQAVVNGSNAIFYAMNVKTGADTITANFASSTTFSLIYIHEYSGLAANPLDQTSSQAGTGTVVTSGAKTTTQANELIFGYAGGDHCIVSGTTGFSVRQTLYCNMSEDMVVSVAGTYSATFTQNISSNWAGLMATFKAAASSNPIGFVQSTNAVSLSSSNGISASFSNNTTAGHTIVVAGSTGSPAISSVSDTQGNTFVQALANGSSAIYYAANIKGGADTVTANFVSSAGFSVIYIHEYSGLSTSPLDQTSSQSGTGTAVTSGAKTTTQANELIFGYASVDRYVQTGGTGFSVRQTAGGNMSEDMIVSTAGTYSATFTQNGSAGWTGLMATFAGTGGGSGGGGGTPKAVITANPTSGVAPVTVAFSGANSTDTGGTITSYAWNFGDGQTSTLVSPSHTYSVVGTYTVSLTVTDNTSSQNSSSTSIAVNAPASYAGVYRIIAGGSSYTDTLGQVWQADAGFNTGNVATTTAAITGTTNPALYQNERYGTSTQAQLEYQLPIANGTYLVNLYFAETDAASEGTGLRVFDVNLQSVQAITNLDLFGTVGANAALIKSAVVTVSNGTLTIDFVRVTGNPKIDAIEVREVSGHDSALPKTSWKVISRDSEESDSLDGSALNATDRNGSTFWITQLATNGAGNPPGYPHEIQVDLGKTYPLSGFQYLPRQDGSSAGWIASYNFYVSTDGMNWGSPVASGTFANSALQKQVSFTPVNARYVQIEGLSEVNGNVWASMAELSVLFDCSSTPSVVFTAPVDEYLQSSGASLITSALACLDPVQNAGWGVQFNLDGANPIKVFTQPTQATYTNLSKAEHMVDAYVINSSGTMVGTTGPTHDQVKQIGIGDYYVTMGDSVTWGQGGTEATSTDGRDMSSGYQPSLNNQLTSFKGYPQEVSDEGIPGTTSAEGLEILPTVLQKHPTSQTFLVMFGMNDARPWLPVPSGQGLNPGDSGYAGSYKDHMQQIINGVKAAAKSIALSKTNVALADCADNVPTDPGYCAPYSNIPTGARNVLIQQYNTVVGELVSNTANGITVTPPDFYNYFYAQGFYKTQYSDNIHPNAAGYGAMANLWFAALK
jgi:lysophospholipase L1-like esterase/PKD repeat protein